MNNRAKNTTIALILALTVYFSQINAFADDNSMPTKTTKPLLSILKRNKAQKIKKQKIGEINLPPVIQGRPKIPFNQLPVMTIDDCVMYALSHNPALMISAERVEASKAGIGQARASYAPRFTAGFNYYHSDNKTRIVHSTDNSVGVNLGVSEMIWDFGRTTAKINMAKYDTLAAEYDHGYELLNVIYQVRVNYYRVLSALANLDIFEQNVRIQTLNYERTKAMFEEGLKSKIDIVNAEVNLADSKIQLVEGQNNLLNAILELENSMYYQEEKPFVVTNTENFGFLKADYKKKIESANNQKPPAPVVKKTEDGLIMLSSGIEHNDIIQDYKLNPMKMSKQDAVDKAFALRPDFMSEKMLVKVQEESLKAIKRQYTPEVTGNLTFGYNRNEGGSYSTPFQVGAGIGLGSINPYGIHYQVKEGENYLNIAKHNVNAVKSDIYWEVQNNYINMRQLERKIPLMNTKVKATLENFELADGRYSVGLNNYVELQDALTNYNNAQLNFVESVLNYNISRETLLKSIGTGSNINNKDGNITVKESSEL